MESQSESIEGQKIGPYTLIEKLGAGASATVYLARDEEDRSWAVKVRRRGVRSMDRRFLREFETMRLLRVPGVVRVHEAGIDDDLLWFSMDLVWGREFLEVIHEEKFITERVPRAIELGTQLFEILTRLHDSGFIHRDVKPSNVLVDKGGQVQVLDFGIGMYFSDHADTLSRSGEILGTIPYMAPEQIANLPFDHRIDLFAAGLMMHEAIDGYRPKPSTQVAWIPRICMDRL
ncbi:MAG: serine/threonine protein kinase, partial [Proteobacteria bacterium]|nr:serine/threonine protein kinase [Pseudomonadota bacterium]